MTYLCHISEMTRTNVTFWVVRVIIRVEKSAVDRAPYYVHTSATSDETVVQRNRPTRQLIINKRTYNPV